MNRLIRLMILNGLLVFAAMGFEKAVDLSEAKALAAKRHKPLLIDFYATWCGPCKWFDAESKKDENLKAALEKVILVKIDAEKGEGPELFKSYGLSGYPNFVLADSQGRIIAGILGYGGAADFIERLDGYLADLEPIEVKTARYERQPNAKDALVLADYYRNRRDTERALGLYREAQKLDATAAIGHEYAIFEVEAMLAMEKPEVFNKALETGQRVMAGDNQMDKIRVSYRLAVLAQKHGFDEAFADFTIRGLALTEGVENEDAQYIRSIHRMNKALHVDGDPLAAFEIKKEQLEPGWEEDSGQLNNLAWWCFENKTNLEQARIYAEKGVALATPGAGKAAVLDTLAEILNQAGDPAGAVTNIKMAIEEHPASEYYPKQLKRFESLLEKKTGT